MSIPIHTENDFNKMREAGSLTAEILDQLSDFIAPGISTDDINTFCHNKIIENGAIPAPLNYNISPNIIPYPKSICTSVNHVVCHGIPSKDKILKNGDIINVDVTVILDGWHGDSSRMYAVGKIKPNAKKLIKITYECLMKSIEILKPGIPLVEIGCVIEKHANNNGYSVVRDFCGHGLGKSFHSPPQVVHFCEELLDNSIVLKKGMFFTIEPMINEKDWRVKKLKDGWTAVTKDKRLSAQFEHSLGITENGVEIFTKSKNNTDFPFKNL